MRIVINSAATDYLTLTSFDVGVASRMSTYFNNLQGRNVAKVIKRMQYEGRIAEGIFLGAAMQGADPHFMLQASGYDAHRAMQVYQSDRQTDNPKCTRIDLQITIARTREDKPLSEYKAAILASLEANCVGRPPNIQMIDKNGAIGETIYIGSRDSERFIRIYDKKYSDIDGIRFETEYKGTIAGGVFSNMLRRDTYATDVLHSELMRLSGIPLFDRFASILKGNPGHLPTVSTLPTTDESRMKWLEETVFPAIRKMYLAGVHKPRLMVMIAELAQMCDDYPLDNSW